MVLPHVSHMQMIVCVLAFAVIISGITSGASQLLDTDKDGPRYGPDGPHISDPEALFEFSSKVSGSVANAKPLWGEPLVEAPATLSNPAAVTITIVRLDLEDGIPPSPSSCDL